MEVTKFEIRKDGDSHIASFTVRLNPDTDKFNDKMEEILDRTRKKLEDMHKINPGDYFIARKPKDATGGLPWIDAMDKFYGVIQKCASIGVSGCVLSENTFMDTRWYDPSWCEKVSPGDVMKTASGGIFIFKEVKDGEIFDYAYLNSFGYVIITNDEIQSMTYSHATPKEAKPLFDALAKGGKRWNAEKMCIEDMPKFYTRPKKDFILSGISKMSPIEIDEAVLFVSALSDREKRGIEDNPKDKTIPKSTPATYEEVLRSWGCSDEEIMLQKKVDEAYEKTLKCLQDASKEYIVSVKEAVTELKTGDMYEGLVAIADSYAGSPSFGKKDALKQVIKLCKKLLNE